MSVLAANLPDLVPVFPLNFQKQELRIKTGDFIGRSEEQMRSKMPLVLWQVSSGGIRLRATSPITVRVRSEGDFVFAENEALGTFAYGRTHEEALEHFEDHVVHFYETYVNLREDQVVGEGARLKNLFETSFHRERQCQSNED